MRHFLLCLLLAAAGIHLHAFTLSGHVSSAKGEAIAYGPVYVKGTTNGTTTNSEGDYSFDLPSGNYTVVFQAMGDTQQQIEVDLTAGNKILNVVLQQSSITFKEAVISDGEDPAYEVIRHAQKMRKFYLDQVNAYSCDVYIKGLQRVTEHPEKIMGIEVD